MAAASGVRRSELGGALRACRDAFIGVGVMSCMINLLYLTGSIFMLEVYDRVIPSRSVPTLVGLVVLAGGLYVAQGGLDLIRGRILGRIGTALDEPSMPGCSNHRAPAADGGLRDEGLQPLRDLDNVRSFLGTQGPGAFFDLPWLPFYLAICFAFHWLLGLTALIGAIILVILTVITELMSRQPAKDAMTLAARRNDLAATSRRNAEVLIAMGMAGRLTKRWTEANESYLAGNQRASDVAGGLGAIAKVLRMMLQSAVLAVGAYLVIHQEASGGIIIAGSILSARALAPVILRSRTGKVSSPRARAGTASTSCSNRCRRRRPRPCCRPVEAPVGRGRHDRAARRSADHRSGRHLRDRGRHRRRRDRAQRIGQVVADPRFGRRLDAGPRKVRLDGAALDQWSSTRSANTSAICRRTSNCSPARSPRTFPVRSRRQIGCDHRRGQGGRRARDDHQDA